MTIHPLTDEHEAEALAFLKGRSIHKVMMAGFIRDNGLVSPHNRGAFYACRNRAGRLEGVALVGHITLVEAVSDDALKALAGLARHYAGGHLILGEQQRLSHFWSHYADAGRKARLLCRELLFERSQPGELREGVPGLRPATLDDLALILPVHAQMALAESGFDPLEADAAGFRLRCARRIEQQRVWVWVEQERLIFKADIASDTPQAVYLEGVYVDPAARRRNYGRRCLGQLERHLLPRRESISLLVNERNTGGQNFFRRIGYQPLGYYETIFLQENASEAGRS